MQIVVPSRVPLQHGAAATRALLTEGYEVTEIIIEDDQHYGRIVKELWNLNRGFILVEDDVVPWPGAIRAMELCLEHLCCYQHPRTLIEGENGFAIGLGCVKFSDELVQKYELDFPDCRWDEVTRPVNELLIMEVWHIHYPPVAHVKASAVSIRRA